MITYLVLGVVEALLITRVILKLLAANPEAGFVRFVYDRLRPASWRPSRGSFPLPRRRTAC